MSTLKTLREHWEDEISEAHERMGDDLAGALDQATVLEFLKGALDVAGYEADFPPDVSDEEIRSPWLHAAAVRLAMMALRIARDEMRQTKTRYKIAGEKR